MFFGADTSLREALGVPSAKVPIGVTTLLTYVIPPVTCYVVLAVLATAPETRNSRFVLWPIFALLAFRATASVDMSHGKPERILLNVSFARIMLFIVIQALSWTLAKRPLVRHLRPGSPSTTFDTLDLMSNLRGHGWNWSRGLHVPRHSRPANRTQFVFRAFLSGITHSVACSTIYRAINTFTAGTRSRSGSTISTIFDETLPFSLRYPRACIISTLAAIAIHSVVQASYDLLTIPGILVFGQSPAQWPPAFDRPWLATSLTELWGRRWHQFWRHTFLTGAYPFRTFFGRTGRVFGAFLSSALFHHLSMVAFDSRSEFWRMLVGFGMMAPGVLAERAFYKSTGRKVGGAVGRAWTVMWLLLWGNLIVDEFARAGAFKSSSVVDGLLPVGRVAEKLVMDFDAWLHM